MVSYSRYPVLFCSMLHQFYHMPVCVPTILWLVSGGHGLAAVLLLGNRVGERAVGVSVG